MRTTSPPGRWTVVATLLFGVLFLLTLLAAPRASLAQDEPSSAEAEAGAVADSEDVAEDEDDAPIDEDWDWDWDRERREVVRMGEDIVIDEDEKVIGDVVAIGGDCTIYGYVTGDVIAVGGSVSLMDGSVVKGDAVSVGGSVDSEDGAVLHGQEVSVGMGPLNWGRFVGPRIHVDTHRGARALAIWWDFLKYFGFFLVGMILYFAFPQRSGIVRQTTRQNFWLALLTGFGSVIGVAIAFVLLCITCIGIVVAFPGIIAVGVLMIGAGAVAVALLGEVLFNRDVKDGRSWLTALLLGLLLLFVVQVISRVLTYIGGPGWVIGKSIDVIVQAAWWVLVLAGFGALILSRLGKRLPGTEPAQAVPATPYPPAGPSTPGTLPPAPPSAPQPPAPPPGAPPSPPPPPPPPPPGGTGSPP
jgi:hypothetical protein